LTIAWINRRHKRSISAFPAGEQASAPSHYYLLAITSCVEDKKAIFTAASTASEAAAFLAALQGA
jgi:hypothetical protein